MTIHQVGWEWNAYTPQQYGARCSELGIPVLLFFRFPKDVGDVVILPGGERVTVVREVDEQEAKRHHRVFNDSEPDLNSDLRFAYEVRGD